MFTRIKYYNNYNKLKFNNKYISYYMIFGSII